MCYPFTINMRDKKMAKKSIKIFIITFLITIICGLAITVGLWYPKLFSKTNISEDTSPILTDEELESTNEVASIIEVEPIPTPTPIPFEEYDIKLLAVGDNLLHMGLVNSGRQPDGSYNYDFLYESIKPYLDKSDISIINQETPMAGNEKGFSGFPYFNSPIEVATAIDNAGFNVVLQSSNHTIDQGMDGLISVCNLWKNYPNITMVGIHENIEDSRDIPIIEIKDKKFAILNYTYGPNLGAVPGDIKDHLNILCAIKEGSSYNELDFTKLNPNVIEDIEKANSMADIVIVCPHWGTEYALEPSSYQKNFAKQMTDAGADVIIGAHPHVPEPVEVITTETGNTSICYYSLGNYISTGQQGESMLEGLAWVSFHVTEDSIYVDTDNSGVLPLVMQYKSGPLRFEGVYALEDYTEDLASTHGIHSWGGVNLTKEKLEAWSEKIFSEWAISKSFITGE